MDIMELLVLIFCVIPAIVTPITISPNGNSPEIKMVGGMMVDVQQGFVPMKPTTTKAPEVITKSNYEKSRKLNLNATKLSINERYRRLIPYMTFYYANDLSTPTTESFVKNVEVEKAEIVEAPHLERQPKKIIHSSYRNIPRYQGNRLTHYNVASANPTKVYKDIVPHNYQAPARVPQNYNPYLAEHNIAGHDFRRFVHKPSSIKFPSSPFAPPTRKPYLNFHNDEDSANIQYYLNDKEESPRYKLVPYEQTPPVKVENYDEDLYDIPPKVPVPVYVPKEQQVYVKPRQQRPQYSYDNVFYQQPIARKPSAIVSENYYEKSRPQQHELAKPVIESGFKPILGSPVIATEAPAYSSTISEHNPRYESEGHHNVQVIDTESEQPTPPNHRPNYYQYVVDEPAYKPPVSNQITLSDLINSLQINKSIPKPITRDNVGSSIRTLLSVLNALKAAPHQNDVDPLVLSTPKPFVAPKEIVPERKPVVQPTEPTTHPNDVDFNQEPYLAPVNPPSQHIDDFSPEGGTSQRFPLQITSDDEGGTPGRPGVDYPVLTTIPPTRFDCKTQRYKGFFADPETRCQVWHYCDLNGGQASFLCPNGTIFSQAGLTCDWWFNVRCASTTQLYVLNESLYKYILPHSPKFPEDYSGPLVDKYLTLKFKEMEEQFRKNKHKASEKTDSDDEENDEEESTEDSTKEEQGDPEGTHMSSVSEASVVVESPGNSGNVERLQD